MVQSMKLNGVFNFKTSVSDFIVRLLFIVSYCSINMFMCQLKDLLDILLRPCTDSGII